MSGIRTHETGLNRLHDFQSCSFDQLGHHSPHHHHSHLYPQKIIHKDNPQEIDAGELYPSCDKASRRNLLAFLKSTEGKLEKDIISGVQNQECGNVSPDETVPPIKMTHLQDNYLLFGLLLGLC